MTSEPACVYHGAARPHNGRGGGRARVPPWPNRSLSGKAQTVLGPVDGGAMGITLPHEHLLIDFKVMFKEPEAAADKGRALAPVTMANLGWVRQNFSSNLDNLRLLDEDVARDEALLFKQAGGQTMVDPDQRRALARSRRAGSHRPSHRAPHRDGRGVLRAGPPIRPRSPGEERGRYRSRDRGDITVGVGDTGVRAGLIGEIGCTWPWTDDEKKVARAAVAAQRETGAPLMIHPGATTRADADPQGWWPRRAAITSGPIMCHIDRTIADRKHLMDLAQTGLLSRVRPLRARDLLLPLQSRLRHAQRRRAHGADPPPHRGRPRAPGARCRTTSPTSTC